MCFVQRIGAGADLPECLSCKKRFDKFICTASFSKLNNRFVNIWMNLNALAVGHFLLCSVVELASPVASSGFQSCGCLQMGQSVLLRFFMSLYRAASSRWALCPLVCHPQGLNARCIWGTTNLRWGWTHKGASLMFLRFNDADRTESCLIIFSFRLLMWFPEILCFTQKHRKHK